MESGTRAGAGSRRVVVGASVAPVRAGRASVSSRTSISVADYGLRLFIVIVLSTWIGMTVTALVLRARLPRQKE